MRKDMEHKLERLSDRIFDLERSELRRMGRSSLSIRDNIERRREIEETVGLVLWIAAMDLLPIEKREEWVNRVGMTVMAIKRERKSHG